MDNILHLNLKKKWFDMIFSGEKPEEYREIKKHWINILIEKDFSWDCKNLQDIEKHYSACPNAFFKKYKTIIFSNGYAKNRPQFTIELKSIDINYGFAKLGAEHRVVYFVLNLGKIISTQNIK